MNTFLEGRDFDFSRFVRWIAGGCSNETVCNSAYVSQRIVLKLIAC